MSESEKGKPELKLVEKTTRAGTVLGLGCNQAHYAPISLVRSTKSNNSDLEPATKLVDED